MSRGNSSRSTFLPNMLSMKTKTFRDKPWSVWSNRCSRSFLHYKGDNIVKKQKWNFSISSCIICAESTVATAILKCAFILISPLIVDGTIDDTHETQLKEEKCVCYAYSHWCAIMYSYFFRMALSLSAIESHLAWSWSSFMWWAKKRPKIWGSHDDLKSNSAISSSRIFYSKSLWVFDINSIINSTQMSPSTGMPKHSSFFVVTLPTVIDMMSHFDKLRINIFQHIPSFKQCSI